MGTRIRRMRFDCLAVILLLVACVEGPRSNESKPWSPPSERDGMEPLVLDGHAVWVRLAKTADARQRGLADVTSLAADEGMLFVYREAWWPMYWMKGCRIPLDVAFLDDQGRVIQVETLQPPAPSTPDDQIPRTQTPAACRLVLELSAGWFAARKLGAGSQVQLPPRVFAEPLE